MAQPNDSFLRPYIRSSREWVQQQVGDLPAIDINSYLGPIPGQIQHTRTALKSPTGDLLLPFLVFLPSVGMLGLAQRASGRIRGLLFLGTFVGSSYALYPEKLGKKLLKLASTFHTGVEHGVRSIKNLLK